ncbi:GNAT family N-acetyltransferase [Brassicibacter mesophilus]|uniref:GNAT family N-acetyltransferase n=1 Tax=Brassicibacter mesophilus TaxID=745119 RepID=UPI003D2324BE
MRLVKRMEEVDIMEFVNISANAYPAMKINTQEEKDSAIERYTKIHKENPIAKLYGIYDDKKIIGGMILYDFTMKLFSTKILAGGVGSVAIDLLHKKDKAAKELITYFINHYRKKESPIVLLYPFRTDFYKKMGFGFGTKKNQYKVKSQRLPKGKTKTKVSYLNIEDKDLLNDCYNRFLDNTNGMIEKTEREIEGIFKNPSNRVVGYKNNDKIEGYMTFTFKAGESGSFVVNDIFVNEFIYNTREALTELMTFLHSQDDQIRYIIFNTQDEYFHHLFMNPSNDSENIIPHVYHESNTQGVGLMYRVINTTKLFEVLSEHNFGGQNCKLKITAIDNFREENNKSIIVNFIEGKPYITEGDFDAEITLDISEFSSLIMGVVNFKALYRLGLADISDTAFIDIVNKIFAVEEKPMCTTGF